MDFYGCYVWNNNRFPNSTFFDLNHGTGYHFRLKLQAKKLVIRKTYTFKQFCRRIERRIV